MYKYNDIDKIIGSNIRRLRKEKKWTQETLTAKLQLEGFDISRGNLAKIEVGLRFVYPKEIVVFAKVFDCDFNEIFREAKN